MKRFIDSIQVYEPVEIVDRGGFNIDNINTKAVVQKTAMFAAGAAFVYTLQRLIKRFRK